MQNLVVSIQHRFNAEHYANFIHCFDYITFSYQHARYADCVIIIRTVHVRCGRPALLTAEGREGIRFFRAEGLCVPRPTSCAVRLRVADCASRLASLIAPRVSRRWSRRTSSAAHARLRFRLSQAKARGPRVFIWRTSPPGGCLRAWFMCASRDGCDCTLQLRPCARAAARAALSA